MTDALTTLLKPTERERSLLKGHGAKTAAVRERAILALLSARTIRAAAHQCEVDESTLRRWLTDDESFKADYEAARAAAYVVGMSRIQVLTARAIETLEDLLDAKEHPAVRLGAARTITEIGMHLHEDATILQRLAAIEAVQLRRR